MNTESMRRRQPDYYLTTICKTPGVIAPQWLRVFSANAAKIVQFCRTPCASTASPLTARELDETGLEITFQVQDHAIRFLSSDCPDKVCVNTGFLREDLQVATCLPNRTTLFLSVSQE